jgi:uncharacterized protein (TIGR03382 family)
MRPTPVAAALACFFTAQAAEAYDFQVSVQGPVRVMRGYTVHVALWLRPNVGGSHPFEVTLEDLPTNTLWKPIHTVVPAHSYTINAAGNLATPLAISPSATTPPGKYMLKVVAKGYDVTHEATFPLEVLDVPAPVSKSYDLTPIPELEAWKKRMAPEGKRLCDPSAISDCFGGGSGNDWAYDLTYCTARNDGAWVYHQIADYTQDATLADCAKNVVTVYRDKYLGGSGGGSGSGYIYPLGLREDFLRNQDAKSKAALQKLIDTTIVTSESWYSNYIPIHDTRGVAQAIASYMAAEAMGQPRHRNLTTYVDLLLGQLEQLGVAGQKMQAEDVAYAAHTLISWDKAKPDPRVAVVLQGAADWLWENARVEPAPPWGEAIRFNISNATVADPPTNLLVAPLFAWLYVQTGEVRFRDRGDTLFASGIQRTALDVGSDRGAGFTATYFWTFDYVRWRDDNAQAPTKPAGLKATARSNAVTLTWEPSTDNNHVKGYRVYRDGELLGTTPTASYVDSLVQPLATYSYAVEAFDPADKVSPRSEALKVSVPAVPDGGEPIDIPTEDGGRPLRPPVEVPPTQESPPKTGCQSTSSGLATTATLAGLLFAVTRRRRALAAKVTTRS